MEIYVPYYLVIRVVTVRTILPLAHVDLVIIPHAYLYTRYVVGNVSRELLHTVIAKRAVLPFANQIQNFVFQRCSHLTFLPTTL